MRMPDAERFDLTCESLCPGLRWKAQFVLAEQDESVPPCNDGIFWCLYTQQCVGPDGRVAEPGKCASARRTCHSTGECR